MVTSPLDERNSHGEGKDLMPDLIRSAPRQMYFDTCGWIAMFGMRYFLVVNVSSVVAVVSDASLALMASSGDDGKCGGRAASNANRGIR